ncbi:ABC transporter ATP-binding protein [Chelativorans sp. Marseille-P2723]|uniref:ABC transporter ATP-binding protein n=1 Tax=Chelativorans sp. Marseille-P2723 TaxID=2709133 RepID=UPI001AED6BC1|nr:ABC transporter ATP-binding protein [Chelativorans sp. Marseille-P2723]
MSEVNSFYGEAHVLNDLSLSVGKGEIVALLGRNGMGKTTLIRSIMGVKPPSRVIGSIKWNGEELIGLPSFEVARKGIGYVPQGRRLFPSLTVTEHLTVLKPAHEKTGWTFEKAFDFFPRLAERRQNRGDQLSGGERQMLAIARTLMTDPNIILMDEPSEGLAPVMVRHLEKIMAELRGEGLGILLVEQNLYSALDVSDRLYVLETGRVVHSDVTANVAANLDSLTQYLGVH